MAPDASPGQAKLTKAHTASTTSMLFMYINIFKAKSRTIKGLITLTAFLMRTVYMLSSILYNGPFVLVPS